MKLIQQFLFVLCLLFSLNLAAQKKDIPSFGKVDKADLEMKDCDFEKSAEAMVLFDVAEVYCTFDFNSFSRQVGTEVERHVRIKILDTRGLDNANIRIRYHSQNKTEEIQNISAQTYNLDASGNIVITKVDKKNIFDKAVNKHYSEIAFAFPDVKPGSIIEYKYKDYADYLYGLKDWYFQRSIPVKLSRYVLDFPSELIISATPQGGLQVNKTEKESGTRLVKTYSMDNIPALKKEPFISCEEDYMQQIKPFMVAFDMPGYPRKSLLRTWPGIIKELMEDEDFGLELKKNIPRTSDLDALLKTITDPYQKMIIIHDYVKKNMEWNEYYGIWAFEGVKSAWKSKKGTTGEINLILVNLLKDADLKAHPLLVSTRKNGKINTSVAGYAQFDKVMAYVSIGDNNYVLDATDKNTPPQLIPYDVLCSEGLLIEKYDSHEWGWKYLWDDKHLFENSAAIEASIDENGLMQGEARITSADYSRLARMPKLKQGKEKFTEAFLNSDNNSLKIDSLEFENTETDSLPLFQRCRFTQPVNSSGGYNYFSANLFSGLEKNPFIADTRFSDVFFGANQVYIIEASFTIPAGYSFDALPKNIKMRLPDTSLTFARHASVSGQKLFVRMQLEFKKPVFSTDEYDGFHEFYKKMFELLNEQFVYKKN